MNTSSSSQPEYRKHWRGLAALPGIATVFVFVSALYILLVAFGNITDYATNYEFVRHVLAMDTTNLGKPAGTGLDPSVMWRAITSPALWNLAYIGVIVWEALSGLVLGVAVVLFVRGLVGHGFDRARAWGSMGLLMIILLFAGGFIAIGGEWFQMWRSVTWSGLDTAFRNAMIAGLGLVIINMPSPLWQQQRSSSSLPR